jgi:hypothetical protein
MRHLVASLTHRGEQVVNVTTFLMHQQCNYTRTDAKSKQLRDKLKLGAFRVALYKIWLLSAKDGF